MSRSLSDGLSYHVYIDVSSSMDGEKLTKAKGAFQSLAEHLRPQDQIELCSFGSSVNTACSLTARSRLGEIKASVTALIAG